MAVELIYMRRTLIILLVLVAVGAAWIYYSLVHHHGAKAHTQECSSYIYRALLAWHQSNNWAYDKCAQVIQICVKHDNARANESPLDYDDYYADGTTNRFFLQPSASLWVADCERVWRYAISMGEMLHVFENVDY